MEPGKLGEGTRFMYFYSVSGIDQTQGGFKGQGSIVTPNFGQAHSCIDLLLIFYRGLTQDNLRVR